MQLPRWQQLHKAVSRFGTQLLLSLRQLEAAPPLLRLPQEVLHQVLGHLPVGSLVHAYVRAHVYLW